MKLEGLCSQTEAYWFYVFWSNVYERMQKYFTSPEMREAGLDLAALSPGLKVLDVGAGTGTLSLQVGARVGAEHMTLLDQSPHMLDQAKAKPVLQKCTFVLSDAQTLPFDDDAFDRVVSSGAIYYFPKPVEAVTEMLRVVRPGGRVLAMGSLQPKPRFIRLFAQVRERARPRNSRPVCASPRTRTRTRRPAREAAILRLLGAPYKPLSPQHAQQVFNRFPTEEEYISWFEGAGLVDVKTQHITNPWNTKAYALAIVGTKPADGPRPARCTPPPATAVNQLRRLVYLPVALVRFGLAMLAFGVIGPLQIINALRGMRSLRGEKRA